MTHLPTITVSRSQVLKIDVDLKKIILGTENETEVASPEDYIYEWKVLVNNSTLDEDMILSTEKNLNDTIWLGEGSYQVNYSVTEKNSGVTWITYFKLRVVTRYTGGHIFLTEDANQNIEIELWATVPDNAERVHETGVLARSGFPYTKGGAKFVKRITDNYAGSGVWVATGENTGWLNLPNFDWSEGNLISGFTPYFSVTSGYRLIHDTEDMDNFTMRLNYYYDENNDPAIDYEQSVRTQLEIIVRANRAGLSLFLQAFINLFSVVIWIIIAFYSQSYTGEDSIGMLGTGLFGVISSMLVGLSMVSDAGIFSLITMINIFTLAVIMIMTYQAIAAKRAAVRKDKVLIAYNGIKLRVLFVLLTICTVAMFVVIPALAYMWSV